MEKKGACHRRVDDKWRFHSGIKVFREAAAKERGMLKKDVIMRLDSFILFSIKTNHVNCGYDNERSVSIKKCGISGVAGQILANQ